MIAIMHILKLILKCPVYCITIYYFKLVAFISQIHTELDDDCVARTQVHVHVHMCTR